MRGDNRATKKWIMDATNVGVVATICLLKERGKDIAWIAGHMETIQKQCGNGAVQASGVNGDMQVASLHDHMRRFAASLAAQLDSVP